MIKRKKWLAVFLFLCLLLFAFSATPIKIYAAAHPVATFDQLQAALTDSGDTIEITITANFGMEATVIIPEDKAVSITSGDGGPFSLTRGADITGDLFTVSADASLTLSNVTLDGNNTVVENALGALINVLTDGELIINDGAALQNNNAYGSDYTAPRAGAIVFNSGSMTMTDGTISGSQCPEYHYVNGVVYNALDATFEMSGGSIRDNKAFWFSGGVYNLGSFTMSGGVISDNEAYMGSGVYNIGTFTLFDGTISRNEAVYFGGGVANIGVFNMVGGVISDNEVDYDDGGGVHNSSLESDSYFTMSGGIISGNISSAGGGVSNGASNYYASMITTDSYFNMSGGIISGNEARSGGGVCNVGGSLFVYDDIIYYYSNGIVQLSGGTISDNTADYHGGGVYNDFNGTFRMSSGNINNNHATVIGGGVCNWNTFELSGGEISGNDARRGGGVFNSGERTDACFTMSGGEISGNKAEKGGGVYNGHQESHRSGLNEAYFLMSGGFIRGNGAEEGGGVYNHGGGDHTGSYYATGIFQLSGGEISGNTATLNGGGIYNLGGETDYDYYIDFIGFVQISGGEISSNTAGIDGGGVYNSSVFSISDGIISNNDTTNNGGGIYNNPDGTVEMTGGEIKNNTAIVDGGGLYTEDYANIELPAGSSIAFSGNTANHPCNPPAAAPVPADQWQGAITSTSLRIPGDKNITVFNNFDINFDGEPFPGPYPIIYHANNGSGGVIDTDSKFPYQPFPAAANTFAAPDGKRFAGWNTKADGSGTTYLPGDEAVMPNEPSPFTFHLYAMWEPISITPVTARPPKTGDTNALPLYEMLLCAAIGLAGFAVSFSKKKRIT